LRALVSDQDLLSYLPDMLDIDNRQLRALTKKLEEWAEFNELASKHGGDVVT
jgi:hypothetical protein